MKDDLISRQSAIEAMDSVDYYHLNRNGEMVHGANPDEHQAWYKVQDVYEALNGVPSAEPLVLTCDGCRHVGTYDTDFPCSVCIRREKDYYEQER